MLNLLTVLSDSHVNNNRMMKPKLSGVFSDPVMSLINIVMTVLLNDAIKIDIFKRCY